MHRNDRSDPTPEHDARHPTSSHDARHPTPEQLSEREREQERLSREAAADADSEQEARADLRRADKARYLQEKLEQQKRADEQATH